MDLAEMFTESVRRVVPLVRGKGLVNYFDYRGPFVEVDVDEVRMQAALHRVLVAMVDVIDTGFVMFTADVAFNAGHAAVTISAAGTGRFADVARVEGVLQRLTLTDIAPAAGADGLERQAERQAFGRCPATGAEVWYVEVPGESMVFSWQMELPGQMLDDDHEARLDARGADAWLVSATEGGLDSLDMRLRRLGWRTTGFADITEVATRLASARAGKPALLLVAESTPAELSLLERLAVLEPSIWIVLGVEIGSMSLIVRGSSPVDVRLLPLSPADLLSFTRHVDPRTSTAQSRLSAGAPLYHDARRRVLVVDDNAVNQMVATGLLDVLGFDVETADDGAQALEQCRERPPALVLMDLHMPVMDGLEASRRLRELQAVGTVPPFPIIAATADPETESREQCEQVGMDGYLQKPLDIHTLKAAILRAMPAPLLHEGYTVF